MREAGGLVRPHHRHSAPQAQQGRTRCVQEGLAATRVEVCAVEDPLPPVSGFFNQTGPSMTEWCYK